MRTGIAILHKELGESVNKGNVCKLLALERLCLGDYSANEYADRYDESAEGARLRFLLLAQKGFVDYRVEEKEHNKCGKRNHRVYSITDLGRKLLLSIYKEFRDTDVTFIEES